METLSKKQSLMTTGLAFAVGVAAGHALWQQRALRERLEAAVGKTPPKVPVILAPPPMPQAAPGPPQLPPIRWIELVKDSGFTPVSLAECQVLDASGKNLLLGNPNIKVTQSSTADDHYAARAIDGNPETFAETQPSEVDGVRKWSLDLGADPPTIAVVVLINRPDGFRDYWRGTVAYFLNEDRQVVASFGLVAEPIAKFTRKDLVERYIQLQQQRAIRVSD